MKYKLICTTNRGTTEEHFEPSGFFLLRTPLLPFSEFSQWSSLRGSEERNTALRRLVERPEIREALVVASPSVERAIQRWLADPTLVDDKLIRTLARYLARISGGTAPFGLSAGSSVGRIGSRVDLQIEGRGAYRRHTRLDVAFIELLTKHLYTAPGISRELPLQLSSAFYHTPTHFCVTQYIPEKPAPRYQVVTVERDPVLEKIFALAQHSARFSTLVEEIERAGTSRAEAEEYIDSLLAAQFLVLNCEPEMTSGDPMPRMLERLRDAPSASDVVERMMRPLEALTALDQLGVGAPTTAYEEIVQRLSAVPIQVDPARTFHVDMYKPAPGLELGASVVNEIWRGVKLLVRLRAMMDDLFPGELERFQSAFLDRFGRRRVRLVEVFDEDMGIPHVLSSSSERKPEQREIDLTVASELLGPALRQGAFEVELTPSLINALETNLEASLPDAFYVQADVLAPSADAISAGRFRVHVKGIRGPSGAIPFGRFCTANPALRALVEEHLRMEERLRPDAIFAEIVHKSPGHRANIMVRPALRDYEISCFGRASVPEEQQIPLDDLFLSVHNDHFVLHSERLGREVIPRLTAPDGYFASPLRLYRFLCMLQHQNLTWMLGWQWGRLQRMPFLPRIRCGRVILTPARWCITRERLASLSDKRGPGQSTIEAFRQSWKIPRFVQLLELEELLPLDLDNPICCDMLAQTVSSRGQANLFEMFVADEDLCVEGPEGRFIHDIVIPFHRTVAPAPSERDQCAPHPRGQTLSEPVFLPGSEWAKIRLACNTAVATRVLADHVHPLVTALMADNRVAHWSFQRIPSAQPSLGLVLQLDKPEQMPFLLAALDRFMSPAIAAGIVPNVHLDAHIRDGGPFHDPEGRNAWARLAQADSEFVCAAIRGAATDGTATLWHRAVWGINTLLAAFELPLVTRIEMMRRLGSDIAEKTGLDPFRSTEVGARFRTERAGLQRLLNTQGESLADLWPWYDALVPCCAGLRAAAVECRNAAHRTGIEEQAVCHEVVCAQIARFFAITDPDAAMAIGMLSRFYAACTTLGGAG